VEDGLRATGHFELSKTPAASRLDYRRPRSVNSPGRVSPSAFGRYAAAAFALVAGINPFGGSRTSASVLPYTARLATLAIVARLQPVAA
jgi:hypothetical protein